MKQWIVQLLRPVAGNGLIILVYVLIISCMMLSPQASASCLASKQLDSSQMSVVKEAYRYGKPHDLGYSLAAIAWKESNAGKWLVNVAKGERSFGPFHISLESATRRTGDGRLTDFQKNVLASSLLGLRFSSTYAIMELEYWQKIHGENAWRNIYASYNGGWNYKKALPQAYASDIIEKMKKLKGCFGEEG